MEEFKVRLIREYSELNERIEKLNDFLKNPNEVKLSEQMLAVMGRQQMAMEEYSRKLWERMEMLGITTRDVIDYNHPYQNLSFGEALQALEAGKCIRRESWIGDKFVVKQIDSDISAEIVPKMQSLPDSAKELIGKTADKDIHYRNQCLVIKQFPSSSVATNYVPDWNDMFAKDWMIV